MVHMSVVQFTLSQRGKRKTVFEGYSYVFDRATDAKEVWRCEERGRCKARLHTVGDNVVRKVRSHCHKLSAARAEAAVVATRVMRRAEETMEMTAQGALPTLGALKQMVRRRRNKLGTPLAAATSLETLIIPEEFTKYAPHHGEIVSFLLADSGPSPQQILIFAVSGSWQFLENQEHGMRMAHSSQRHRCSAKYMLYMLKRQYLVLAPEFTRTKSGKAFPSLFFIIQVILCYITIDIVVVVEH
ncbi:hypothetical protein T11_16259 [Trichinella zimbabwensis]|uniref:FLYWCH-type domain-containing protein n=1 Tax=Trichinella zimbabwensis TaxID=268475 RepID=A0A0V1GTU9_9BILA|nr:hypothetical protein T11_5255 [Trichinella zimbabwensis]KRZ01697.1 hypothetical protein T11_16259 [Trichinella zimbabwensis]